MYPFVRRIVTYGASASLTYKDSANRAHARLYFQQKSPGPARCHCVRCMRLALCRACTPTLYDNAKVVQIGDNTKYFCFLNC